VCAGSGAKDTLRQIQNFIWLCPQSFHLSQDDLFFFGVELGDFTGFQAQHCHMARRLDIVAEIHRAEGFRLPVTTAMEERSPEFDLVLAVLDLDTLRFFLRCLDEPVCIVWDKGDFVVNDG
jgi:hypothetical protein